MTVQTDIAEVRFDLTGRDIGKLTSLMHLCNSKLEGAEETLRTRSEKVAAGDITSFVLDAIIEARSNIRVYATVASFIKNALREGLGEATIFTEVKDIAIRNAMMSYTINSSSNVSVEIDLSEKVAWGRFFEDLRWS